LTVVNPPRFRTGAQPSEQAEVVEQRLGSGALDARFSLRY
jgi:hypothetical protein